MTRATAASAAALVAAVAVLAAAASAEPFKCPFKCVADVKACTAIDAFPVHGATECPGGGPGVCCYAEDMCVAKHGEGSGCVAKGGKCGGETHEAEAGLCPGSSVCCTALTKAAGPLRPLKDRLEAILKGALATEVANQPPAQVYVLLRSAAKAQGLDEVYGAAEVSRGARNVIFPQSVRSHMWRQVKNWFEGRTHAPLQPHSDAEFPYNQVGGPKMATRCRQKPTRDYFVALAEAELARKVDGNPDNTGYDLREYTGSAYFGDKLHFGGKQCEKLADCDSARYPGACDMAVAGDKFSYWLTIADNYPHDCACHKRRKADGTLPAKGRCVRTGVDWCASFIAWIVNRMQAVHHLAIPPCVSEPGVHNVLEAKGLRAWGKNWAAGLDGRQKYAISVRDFGETTKFTCDDVKPGDIVFVGKTVNRISHVGMATSCEEHPEKGPRIRTIDGNLGKKIQRTSYYNHPHGDKLKRTAVSIMSFTDC